MTLETRIELETQMRHGQSLAEDMFGLSVSAETEAEPDAAPVLYEPTDTEVEQAQQYIASHESEDLSPILLKMLRSLPVDYGKDDYNELSMYIHEIMEIPLLDADMERQLFEYVEKGRMARRGLMKHPHKRDAYEKRIQQGLEAEEHLILANTRWVFSLAKKFRGNGLELLDLIQEGNIGLHRALKKFDVTRGNRFSTYATCWIRHTIQNAIEREHPMHLSRDQQLSFRHIRKTQTRLTNTLGRRATYEEVAASLGMDVDTVIRHLTQARHPLSLEEPKGSGGGEPSDRTIGDSISESHVIFQAPVLPEAQVTHNSLHADLFDALKNLPERERDILLYRYGLTDGEPHTLEESGVFFGVKKQRIHQLEKQGISRITPDARTKLAAYLGRDR